jgi:hypothetical protein
MKEGSRNRVPVAETTSLNLAEYASAVDGEETQINFSIKVPIGITECSPSLCVSALYNF